MKKQVRCVNCNSRLFDIHEEPRPVGVVTIKCRRCGAISNIDLSLLRASELTSQAPTERKS